MNCFETNLNSRPLMPTYKDGRRVVEGKPLTGQERRVADFVKQGRTNKEIARAMSVAPGTIKNYVSCVFRKMGVTTRTELAVKLLRS